MWNEWLARTLRPRPEREQRPRRAHVSLLAPADVVWEEAERRADDETPAKELER
ncbi:MAG TPA: hypothetical protein VET85_00290 [Stellaceae bacterium]|nr:hypothetical protein [Stellaceae bacterium]